MPARLSTGLRRALFLAAALLCLGFAPVAAEFGLVTLQGEVPTYARILAALVSEPFAYGPESGFAQLTPHWLGMAGWLQVTLAVHALLASIVLVACLGLLHDGLRARWPEQHRVAGRWTALLATVAMVLAVAYLSATPMDAIYGGAPFALGLWGMTVLSMWALGMGVDRARRGDVDAHKAFMWMFAAALFVAPSLRLHWVLFGWLLGDGTHATQATAHVLALVVLSVQTPMLAIVVMARHRRRRRPQVVVHPAVLSVPVLGAVGLAWASGPFFTPLGTAAAGPVLGASALVLGVSALPLGRAQPRWVVGGLGLLTMAWALALGQHWPEAGLASAHLALGQGAFFGVLVLSASALLGLALRGLSLGDHGLVWEQGVHGLALAGVPAAHSLGLQLGLDAGLTTTDAWLGAMVLVPGVLLSFSYYVTAFRGSVVAAHDGVALAA